MSDALWGMRKGDSPCNSRLYFPGEQKNYWKIKIGSRYVHVATVSKYVSKSS